MFIGIFYAFLNKKILLLRRAEKNAKIKLPM